MLKPLSVLSGYVERVRAGRADPIPESKRQHISREFDLLFDRFNAMARALNEHEELASHLADQEKYAVLGKLASGMAHEVNNPLGDSSTPSTRCGVTATTPRCAKRR